MDRLEHDGAAVRFPPPLVYLIAVILGGLLHAFVLPLPLGLPFSVRLGAAVLAVLLGLAIGGNAFGHFRRTGQDPKPWESTPEIISTGIYRFTRNPMYVGMALIQIGIGIGLGNGWIIALVLPVLVLVYLTAIRHEEAYLEQKFGETYTKYKSSVRRWL
ncbi:MAG TPA: isoprenylcysteine carboxyl methyltransferase [Deltaproteobacteria bacterium]|jgi:protein-S-isoprenylcysteine O-methyltransferase Ste14|nr:isoprenylcysteine carboxyl methyltransferase [Deltaproteobacteria bacterium]